MAPIRAALSRERPVLAGGQCYIEFANAEVGIATFEVLVDFGGIWRPASDGAIPAGSFQTGAEGAQPLYSCRAYVEGGMHIGKIRSDFGGCRIGNLGNGIKAVNYEVLRNAWVVAQNGAVPANAMPAGNEAGGQPLFFCRGATAGGIHVGKVRPGFAEGCHTAFNQSAVYMASYEVLISDVTPLWLPAPDGVPSGAFNTGFDGNTGLFYTCRAQYQGGLQIGRTGAATARTCRLDFANAGVDVNTYEVLGIQAADWSGVYKIFTKATGRFWGEAAPGDRLISTRTTVADDAFARFTFQKQANLTYRIVAGSGRHSRGRQRG